MARISLGNMVEIMIDRQATIDDLRAKEMVVHFTKKNGEERIMTCTLRPDFIPQDSMPKGTTKKEPKPLSEQTACSVYDVQAKGWRSFLWDNVTEIKDIDTAMAQTLDSLQHGSKRYYRITMSGYGGELVYGAISKEAYDWWVEKDEELLENYVHEDDEEALQNMGVPVEADFRHDDGYHSQWYEVDTVEHDNGVAFDNAHICVEQVEDDTWNAKSIKEVFDGTLEDFINKTNKGEFDKGPAVGGNIGFVQNEFDTKEPYLFYGMSVEKGSFFDGMVVTNGTEFNPRLLSFSATDYPNGDNIIGSLTYNGEDVDNNGGDTRGKAMYFEVMQW